MFIKTQRKEYAMCSNSFYGFREKGIARYQGFALEIVPSWRCQLRCKNCYKGQKRQKGNDGNMPVGFVESSLRQAKECGFSEAVFMGGEPTLHPNLPDFVAMSLATGLQPIIVSNGMKLAEVGYAAEAVKPGTTFVLHAPLPVEVQDEEVAFFGYAEKLRQAYENIAQFGKAVTIVAEVVVIKEFMAFIPEACNWCRERGVIPFVEFCRRDDNGVSYQNNTTPEEVLSLFQELQRSDDACPSVLVPPAYHQACTMSITGVHVKNFGDGDYGGVYSCCAQKVRHGDLRLKPLAEIMADPSFEVFKCQDDWIYGPCRQCRYYLSCRGGCRGEAALAFGCARASNPFCWHIPPQVRTESALMAPANCDGCPLKGNPACNPKH